MRSSLARTASLVAAVLLVALPGSAFAQSDEFEAHGEGEGFLLTIPEVVDIGGGNTNADLTSDPTAHAWGAGFLLAEDSISEVTIERNGVSERDPSEGENCGGPDLPDPFAELADLACSVAEGDTTGSHSSASASATGAEVSVTGADVSALVEFLLTNIDEGGLGDAIDEVERQVLDPVREALATACLELVDPLGEVFAGAADLIEAIEESSVPVEIDLDAEEPCALLVQYVTDPPVLVDEDDDGAAGPDDVLALLQAELEAALVGVSLLDVILAGSNSSATETADAVTGAADALGLDVSLPSLNLLGNVVTVLTDIVDGFLTEVGDDIAEIDLGEFGLPAQEDLVDDLLAAIPQELQSVLDSDQPLLTITGGQADASATYDRDSEEVTTEGTVAPLIVDLNDDLAALLMLEEQDPIVIPEGGSETIAGGTPLESTITLAACTTEDAESNGLTGKRIHCAGLDLSLLAGIIGDDGLRVAGAAATASAFGAAVSAPADDEPPLPDTGGGLALLGLAALGTAIGLRRRR